MKELKKLIDLKSIITMLVTGGLIYGFVVGKVSNEQFMQIAIMIFTFYFAKKDKEEPKEETKNEEEVG